MYPATFCGQGYDCACPPSLLLRRCRRDIVLLSPAVHEVDWRNYAMLRVYSSQAWLARGTAQKILRSFMY